MIFSDIHPGTQKKLLAESFEEGKLYSFVRNPGKVKLHVILLPLNRSGRLIPGLFIFFMIFAFVLMFIPEILDRIKSGYPEDTREIYVAVMPFFNITNDTIYNVWQVGIQDNLISYLSNYPEEFRIRQTGTIQVCIKERD